MKRTFLKFVTLVTIATVPFTVDAAGFSHSDSAVEAARRVNISGRQRMLSQRISKAACFISSGISADGFTTQLDAAVSLFDTSLDALFNGDSAIGLGAEHNTEILNVLGLVESDWAVFSGALQALQGGEIASLEMLSQIDSKGLQLLANMNRAVNITAKTYGESLPDMPLILSVTIDLAGRQRMFTQKAAKEYCLISAGVDVDENRVRLAETVNLFSRTLEALQVGMSGIVIAAPNEQISEQLSAVAIAWNGPKAALEQVARGVDISNGQQNAIVNDMEQVLVLMNEAVGMYEEAIPD